MVHTKNNFYIVITVLALCLALFQNCTKPIDYSLLDSDQEISEDKDLSSEGTDQDYSNLKVDIYTVPHTILSVGDVFSIVATVTSDHDGLTYKFKKNNQEMGNFIYDNGKLAQTYRLLLNTYDEIYSYSVGIYSGDKLLEERQLTLNAHPPEEEVEDPEEESACPKVEATAHKQGSASTYIFTWKKEVGVKYTKIELLHDEKTADLQIAWPLIVQSNYTQITPKSDFKSSIRYQVKTTCEDGSVSFSNIVTINLNN